MRQLSQLALAVPLLALLACSVCAQCGPHGCSVGNAPIIGPGPIYDHGPGDGFGYGYGYYAFYGGVYDAIALLERPHPQANLFPSGGWTQYPGQAGSGVPSMSNYSHINGVAPPAIYAQQVTEKLQHLGIPRHPPETKFLYKNPAIGDNALLPTPKAWLPKLDEENPEMSGERRPKDKEKLPKPMDKDKNKKKDKNSTSDKERIDSPTIEKPIDTPPRKPNNGKSDD